MRSSTPSFLLFLALAACGGGAPTELAPSWRAGALTATNGHSLNGHSLNGHSLNGHSLNGVSLNGVSLNGVSLNGHSLNGIALQGSQLVGVTDKSKFIAGTQLVGASITGVLSDGSTLPLHVDDVSKGTGSNPGSAGPASRSDQETASGSSLSP